MKYYAPERFGTHHIKVLFQYEQYKGSMTFEMGGNCKGLDIVKQDIETILDENVIKNAEFSNMDISVEVWYEGTICLTDDNGDKLETYFYDEAEVEDLIVGIEIVDFKPDENTK